jgi:hypothetical protein
MMKPETNPVSNRIVLNFGLKVLSKLVLAMLLVLAITASAQCRFSVARQGRFVTYRFEPETASGLVFHVTLEFQIGASGTEQITVPSNWAGETLHAITTLRSLSNDVVLSDGGGRFETRPWTGGADCCHCL